MHFVPLHEDCNPRKKFSEIKVVLRDKNPIILKILFNYLLIKPRIIYEPE